MSRFDTVPDTCFNPATEPNIPMGITIIACDVHRERTIAFNCNSLTTKESCLCWVFKASWGAETECFLNIDSQIPCEALGVLNELANILAKVDYFLDDFLCRLVTLFNRVDNCVFGFLYCHRQHTSVGRRDRTDGTRRVWGVAYIPGFPYLIKNVSSIEHCSLGCNCNCSTIMQ